MPSIQIPIKSGARRGLAATAVIVLIAMACATEEPTAAQVEAPATTEAAPAFDAPEAPATTAADPAFDAPEAPATTVVAEVVSCSDDEHADGSGGCHPDHDDVITTTTAPTAPTTTTAAPTTTTAAPTPTSTAPTTTVATTTSTATTTTTVPATAAVPTSTTVAPDPDDPWERVKHEAVPASDLYPDENLPDNLWCGPGETGCWYAAEPEPEPEPEPDGSRRAPAPDPSWVEPYAGYVPPVHADTDPASWGTGEWAPASGYDYLGNDRPRSTPALEEWSEWCRGGSACDRLRYAMKWALDYLGADEACVVAVYYARWKRANASNWLSGAEIDRYSWHRCPTVIDPRTPTVDDPFLEELVPGWDVLLLTDSTDSLADRCRAVLPDDVALEFFIDNNLEDFHEGLDCGEWGTLAGTRRLTYKVCDASALLAKEWMEHHHEMPVRHRGFLC